MSTTHCNHDLVLYLQTLAHGASPTEYFDVRWKTGGGAMHRQFVSSARMGKAAALISRLARSTDVYIGVALRASWTYGGASAIAGSRLLYVDCDTPNVTVGSWLACRPRRWWLRAQSRR
jgi:hypothetical protein